MKIQSTLYALGIAFMLFSCNEDDVPEVNTAVAVQINNLPADPPLGRDSMGTPYGTTDRFTFFRFSDSVAVEHADSATNKWDIGFKSNVVIVNSGVSGPGQTSAFLYDGLFGELKEVPADSAFQQDEPGKLAIGKGWYNYNPSAMTLTPKPGKIIFLRTNEGKYVKMEILSYYKDSPATPNAFTDKDRYYTFRYVHQNNGTTKFE
ncbi:MAG: HmuY family protein [Saprospiraceae bacterium]|nr:HmuY family protein [Saprospiraceae bacterium]